MVNAWKSEFGKATEKKKRKTGENDLTCNHFEMTEKDDFEDIAPMNNVKDFDHFFKMLNFMKSLQSC